MTNELSRNTNDEIDLWADEEDEPELIEEKAPKAIPSIEGYSMSLGLVDEDIIFHSKEPLPEHSEYESLLGLTTLLVNNVYEHKTRFTPLNAFVLRYALKGVKVNLSKQDGMSLKEAADRVPQPHAELTEDRKSIIVTAPNLKIYRNLLAKVNAYPGKSGYKIPVARAFDLQALSETLQTRLPKIKFNDDVQMLSTEPIPGFDGTLESLKSIPVGVLNVISANGQNWKSLKNSKETLEEKLTKYGVKSLYDLMFRLPRKYIDKSNPQDIRDLIEGESATIVGKIKAVDTLPGNIGGTSFMVEDSTGNTIRVAFWRQQWLRTKYNVRDEVLITGKFSWWMRKPQLNGESIDLAEDVAVLPIVPIYKQSESKGLTTYLFMAANRELLFRLGAIELPIYFKAPERMNYHEALLELHFPTSLDEHRKAIDILAYYELVYMQLIMQEAKNNTDAQVGIKLEGSARKTQAKAIKSLPFTLTNDQKKAIIAVNQKMKEPVPSSSLLIGDVGSGKTAVAQMACLKAVESGAQAVLIGPTDILARQLYATFVKLVENLETKTGEKANIAFLSGSMKAKERKVVLAGVESGEIDVLVGTQSVFSDKVKYHNLGFVAIDEQQKFGAEQRTKLLNSRDDNKVPDLLLQTATPIPRSTAQVLYGDMDIIEIREKPAGRLPIITEWIEEDPQELVDQAISPIWSDISKEAEKGNQTFVITPLVIDSDKVDAASVERTFKLLSEKVLPHLRVGLAHGQMKGDAQKEEMAKFRNKEYDVLVASTVVEVGVDIPDATRVVILSADRMGASSLHQIRGRVGRNSKQSKCYLVSLGKNDNSRVRLQSLVDSENGFEIAKIDLATRGEGKMFSSEQSGRSEMIFASLAKHGEVIKHAKAEAIRILKTPLKGLALRDAREKFESDERLF